MSRTQARAKRTQVPFVDPPVLEPNVYHRIKQFLNCIAKPPTPKQAAEEKHLAGKCVARRMTDARIVACADNCDALEQELAKKKIDPESVVIDFVQDSSAVFLDS
jgi:hypothetical protein